MTNVAKLILPPMKSWRWIALGIVTLCCAVLVSEMSSPGPAQGPTMMAAVAIASLASSIAGFAFSAICGAMLFHLPGDPVQVVQIMVTCSVASQAAMTWSMRQQIDWHRLSKFLLGGFTGLPLGVWLLLDVDRASYIRALGIFLLGYGAFMLLRKPMVVRRRLAGLDIVTGFLGGITGGAAGFPGAFVTIWCGMQGWDKARQRAVFQPFILLMQIAALVLIGVARQNAQHAAGLDVAKSLLYVPAALLGTTIGLICYRRITDIQFARAINILLIVSGLSYVF